MPKTATTPEAIEEMTVAQLRDELKTVHGIGTRGNKPALQALLTQARKDAQERPEEQKPPSETSDDVSDAPTSAQDTPEPPPEPPTLAEIEQQEARTMLARREPTAPPTALPSAKEFEASLALAESIAATEFVPRSYRNRPDAVLAAILAGRELGVGPMQALRDIHMIDGRPALAAHLQLALLRRGHGKARIEIMESESTDKLARIKAQRMDTGEVAEVSWTIEEAEQANLLRKDNWKGYPADMLWSRCVGRLTRRLGSDLVAGLPYTAEEVRDFDLENEGQAFTPMQRQNTDVRRDNEPAPPKSWPEINEWADAYGPTFGWPEWLKQAAITLFGAEAEDKTKLTGDQRKKLGVKAASVIYQLRQNHDPSEFPPVDRDAIQKAWARVLDGAILPGPEWAMSPGEIIPGGGEGDLFRTYTEVTGEELPEPPAEAVADSDVEVVPEEGTDQTSPPLDGTDDIEWPDEPPFAGGGYE